VWRRRAFWKRNAEPKQPAHLRITAICENSWWHWLEFDMKGGGSCDIKVYFVWSVVVSNCFTGFFVYVSSILGNSPISRVMFDLVQAMYTRFNVLLCCIHFESKWSRVAICYLS
jgi:hypothetical protein